MSNNAVVITIDRELERIEVVSAEPCDVVIANAEGDRLTPHGTFRVPGERGAVVKLILALANFGFAIRKRSNGHDSA